MITLKEIYFCTHTTCEKVEKRRKRCVRAKINFGECTTDSTQKNGALLITLMLELKVKIVEHFTFLICCYVLFNILFH